MPMCAESQATSDRLNESLKRLDNLHNVAQANGERVLYSRSVLKYSFVDCYAEKELSLILNAQISGEGNAVRRRLFDAPGTPPMNDTMLVLQLDAIDISVRGEGNQEAMFVSFVENVNGPNKKIPSTVRAYLVKHQPKQSRAGFVYFSPAQGTFKFFMSGKNGKLGEAAESAGCGSFNGFNPSIVEGAFEVVDSITNQQGDGGKELLSVCDIVNDGLIGRLRVNLDARHVTVWQVGEPFFQFIDMLVGPFDLCSGVAKLHREKSNL
jgi:hypothetical protein